MIHRCKNPNPEASNEHTFPLTFFLTAVFQLSFFLQTGQTLIVWVKEKKSTLHVALTVHVCQKQKEQKFAANRGSSQYGKSQIID